MDLDSLRKKLKQLFRKKPKEGEPIPKNWLDDLDQEEVMEIQEDGTVKVIYEPKKTERFIARRIKRLLCFLLIAANFILLVTCFFVEGGIMSPFFGLNTVFLTDYYWKTRPQPVERWND